MDPRTQERVERWESRPFSGGLAGLRSFADEDFSGAVTAGGNWLFMLNGRVVGIVDGTLEGFDGASGTAYVAPHPSLPLLCTMETQGGETRAKYYTNDTAIADVDQTLQSSSFTGYVELREQVLSGDYYLVYYGGRRMAAAYIGNAERLLTGDEAFERADDEVGIYQVIDVDLEVRDVPGAGDTVAAGTDSTTSGQSAESSGAGSAVASGGEPGDSDSADSPSSATGEPDVTGTKPAASASESTSNAAKAGQSQPQTSQRDSTDDTPEPDGITADRDPSDSTGEDGVADDRKRSITADEPAPTQTGHETTDEVVGRGDGDDGSGDSTRVADADTATNAGTTASADTNTATGEPASANTDSNGAGGGEPAGNTEETEQTAQPMPPTASSSDDERSGPDPAVVDAAAAELEDVSWDEAEDAEDGASVDGPTTDGTDSGSRSEPSTSGDSRSSAKTDADTKGDVNEPTNTDSAPGRTDAGPDSSVSNTDKPASRAREERFEREAQWRETRRIPSIDPDRSSSRSDRSNARGRSHRSGDRASRRSDAGSTSEQGRPSKRPQQATETADASETSQASARSQQSGSKRHSQEPLEQEMLEREDKIDQLTQRIDELEDERDRLQSTAAELEDDRDRLQSQTAELEDEREMLIEERDGYRQEAESLSATVDQLRQQIESLETELAQLRQHQRGDVPINATELQPRQALEQTNLFVRYGSKSEPTLEAAHDGASREAVMDNLRLEHHTQFDAESVVVDGDPFEEFLQSTLEYQFVAWLTQTLPFEIRDTGRQDGLSELYGVLPLVDRAELNASVSLADDDTEGVPETVTFDVVVFDKRGNPLIVADVKDSREPASKGLLESLEADASAIKANYPELGGALAVTSSFFDPGALEVTEAATSGGGILSRGSRLSFVSLSRKLGGYHLCLIESRAGGFHVTVPEL